VKRPQNSTNPTSGQTVVYCASLLGLFSLISTAALGVQLPSLSSLRPATSRALEAFIKGQTKFKNWGLGHSQNNSHIHAAEAWKIQQGSKNVVVAVIDTGIDAQHPDLAPNLWQDAKSKSSSTTYGWDFVSEKANPRDDHGHGTHVAGIIGAVANLQSGTAGVAQKVSLMAVKYYSDKNSGAINLRNTIRALDYAIDHGAQIINYSGGGPEFSEEEYLAIKRAESRGILVVAAAGNERQNTDQRDHYYYPAAYGLKNIISVASTDMDNNLLPSSNWGKTKVDVAAPGENIYSTLPGGKHGYMTGTSQATGLVTGIAVLLKAQNPKLKPEDLKALIMRSVDHFPQLSNKIASGGKVNAQLALLALRQMQSPTPTLFGSAGKALPILSLPGQGDPNDLDDTQSLSAKKAPPRAEPELERRAAAE
jgi:thermitase